MKLPTNFKATIAKTFYDKEIDVMSSQVVTESDGWTKFKDLVKTGSFMGNVRFDNLQQVQEDFGITEKIDLAISCDTSITSGTILQYDGLLYKVLDAKKRDSHTLLIAQKWSSKLSTLTSA